MQDIIYTQFEDKFRGTEQQIAARLKQYNPLLRLLNKQGNLSAVDLGCGRGEWLTLLTNKGWKATGIDLNKEMVKRCQEKGLDVEEIDALSYLQTLPDNSQHLISGFHIAEHIAFDELYEIFAEAYRVLQPEGVLLLETPNPENLNVGAHSFYIDPTHLHPLPPVLMEFTAQSIGFEQAKIRRLNGSSRPTNEMAFSDYIQWFFEANLDYALIAQKTTQKQWQSAIEKIGEPENHHAVFFQAAREYSEGLTQQIENLTQQIENLIKHTQHLQEKTEQTDARVIHIISQLHQELQQIKNSRSWRVTRPLRLVLGAIKGVQQDGLKETAKIILRSLLKKQAVWILRHPRVLKLTLRLINKLPSFKKRLKEIIGSSNKTTSVSEVVVFNAPAVLNSPRAKQIWQDLCESQVEY